MEPEINQEVLNSMLEMWKDKRHNWEGYDLQISFFESIRENVPKINHYFKGLSSEKKRLFSLKEARPINYFLWQCYKDDKIDFNEYRELIKQFYSQYDLKKGREERKESWETIPKKLISYKNIEEEYVNRLFKNYKEFLENKGQSNWYFYENKEYYSLLLEDNQINDIIESMFLVFNNTNSGRGGGSRGAPKTVINQDNCLLDFFELFELFEYFDLKKIDDIIDSRNSKRLNGLNIIGKEAFGFYHLLELGGFIYNTKVDEVFEKTFKDFNNKAKLLEYVSPFYPIVKEKFVLYFKEDLELKAINKILEDKGIKLSVEEKREFNINLQIDQMIYCFDQPKTKEQKKSGEESCFESKNLILYGPPGTGKTFITKQKAVKIIENG